MVACRSRSLNLDAGPRDVRIRVRSSDGSCLQSFVYIESLWARGLDCTHRSPLPAGASFELELATTDGEPFTLTGRVASSRRLAEGEYAVRLRFDIEVYPPHFGMGAGGVGARGRRIDAAHRQVCAMINQRAGFVIAQAAAELQSIARDGCSAWEIERKLGAIAELAEEARLLTEA
ncbi:MAG: hypothetical protein SFZ23_07655 [Planctomycetota bacterium]|nr:hypothetical protein [Planctomycetota bacterium]